MNLKRKVKCDLKVPVDSFHPFSFSQRTLCMIMKRSRKKAPIASSNSAVSARSNVSKRVTQSTISSFHTLLKQKAIIKRQLSAKGDDDEALLQRLSVIEQRLKDLGGLEAYQAASRLGQSDDRGGDSSRVLIDWLKTGVGRNGKDRAHGERPLRYGTLVFGGSSYQLMTQDAGNWCSDAQQLCLVFLMDRQSAY